MILKQKGKFLFVRFYFLEIKDVCIIFLIKLLKTRVVYCL